MKSFRDLWNVVVNYINQRRAWWTGKLQNINSNTMLENTEKWADLLHAIFKIPLVTENAKPNQLLHFIKGELATIKEYIPVIVSLKTKGLSKRHIMKMQEALDMTIDPSNMTLADLKAKNLTRGPSYDIIKSISETAMKEHNVKIALDAIDREL